jgi:DNA helicase-2/ATP-dependent DNA helicase PcrA
MNEGIDLLAISRGLVTAPAGCGKTELIIRSIAQHKNRKPILILTHTNSGVAALRTRLNRAAVPSKHYRLPSQIGAIHWPTGTLPRRL